jgi:hypothetical protein
VTNVVIAVGPFTLIDGHAFAPPAFAFRVVRQPLLIW